MSVGMSHLRMRWVPQRKGNPLTATAADIPLRRPAGKKKKKKNNLKIIEQGFG